MKKICSALLLCILLSLPLLGGCNRISSGTMADIAGTYELTHFSESYKDKTTGEMSESVDLLAEKEMKSWIILTEGDMGYYVYQDKDTALICKEVRQEPVYDTPDHPDLVKSVILWDGMGFSKEVYTQVDAHTLTDNQLALFGTTRRWEKYERTSGDQTLSTAAKALGTTLDPMDWEWARFDGVYEVTHFTSEGVDDSLLYAHLVIDGRAHTATLYGATKDDPTHEMVETCTLSQTTVTQTYKVNEGTPEEYTVTSVRDALIVDSQTFLTYFLRETFSENAHYNCNVGYNQSVNLSATGNALYTEADPADEKAETYTLSSLAYLYPHYSAADRRAIVDAYLAIDE